MRNNNNTNQSKSPSPGAENRDDHKRNRPVVAKTNFVIAHKGILGKAYKDEGKFEQNKEVDEWLMGSGESNATASSSISNLTKKQQELEKPVQPRKSDEMDTVGDDEDWMFKTFNPHKEKSG